MKTYILRPITFFPKIAPFMRCPKNAVETEGPQMTSQYGEYAFRAGLARLYAHALWYPHARTQTSM